MLDIKFSAARFFHAFIGLVNSLVGFFLQDEVLLQFHVDDTTGNDKEDTLLEMAFHVPPGHDLWRSAAREMQETPGDKKTTAAMASAGVQCAPRISSGACLSCCCMPPLLWWKWYAMALLVTVPQPTPCLPQSAEFALDALIVSLPTRDVAYGNRTLCLSPHNRFSWRSVVGQPFPATCRCSAPTRHVTVHPTCKTPQCTACNSLCSCLCTPVQALAEELRRYSEAAAGGAGAAAVASFYDVSVLAPRGRFTVEMYPGHMKLTGQVSA